MESKLTQLSKEKSRLRLQYLSLDAQKWLEKKVAALRNTDGKLSSSIVKDPSRGIGSFYPGGLYCFFYDAKTKDALPYWDKFPLVLVLQQENDGFLGLNLHYLPTKLRAIFLDKLMPFTIFNNKNGVDRIRVTYDILSMTKSFREFKPCIKKYLNGNIKSKIIQIQPQEWDTAIFLPTHMFQKEPARQVWKESVEEIRKKE